MTVWMLSQFYNEPANGWEWPVAASYSNGHDCPQHPVSPETWALVRCESSGQQLEAAAQDPRVHPYRTLWDILTPETVSAYASKGAASGMMLGQLLQILAESDPGYAGMM
jgi:hypothetical protein